MIWLLQQDCIVSVLNQCDSQEKKDRHINVFNSYIYGNVIESNKEDIKHLPIVAIQILNLIRFWLFQVGTNISFFASISI